MAWNILKLLLPIFAMAANFNTSAQIITTIAGNGTAAHAGDGTPATDAEINQPWGIAVDGSGNVFFTEAWGRSLRKINSTGIITTICGLGSSLAYSGEAATSAGLDRPYGVALDGSGNCYVSDISSNLVLKINGAGNIYRVAGNFAAGYSGDGALATNAALNGPSYLAVDGSGNIFIADQGNNVIRKVNTAGVITTIAGSSSGTAGLSGDGGPATNAELNQPSGVAVDATGNVFIADATNHRVRKVNTSGIITTVAGGGSGGSGSPATAAYIWTPAGVTVDGAGNLYIVDAGSNVTCMVNTSGIMHIIAGTGAAGYGGDGGQATAAVLNWPAGIVLDATGYIYIADEENSRLRKIKPLRSLGTATCPGTNISFSVYPNPNTGSFTLKGSLSSVADRCVSVQVTNMLGQVVYTNAVAAQNGQINTSIQIPGMCNGLYLLNITGEGENDVLRFVIDK